MNTRPSRLAAWLATRRVPRDEREFVLGDLEEEFTDRLDRSDRGMPVLRARLWYWRQALRCFIVPGPRRIIARQPAGHRSMNLAQDIRFALRILRRMPGFTVTAVLTLALGIGAATGMFSVVHAVLGAPLPFSTGDRLVIVREGATLRDSTPVSNQRFEEWREDDVLEDTAGVFLFDPSLTGTGEPERLSGLRVSASFFEAVNLRPALGTTFTRGDESRSVEPKVLIGDGLWRRRFGASPDVIGRRITLSDITYTVVGVLPAGFRFRPTDPTADLIGPLRLNDTVAPPSLNFMTVIGLLRPGQHLEEARDRLQASVRHRHPDREPPLSITVARLRDMLDARVTPGAARAACRRRVPAAHRLCQSREPAAGASDRSRSGVRDTTRPRRRAGPTASPAADGKLGAVGDWRCRRRTRRVAGRHVGEGRASRPRRRRVRRSGQRPGIHVCVADVSAIGRARGLGAGVGRRPAIAPGRDGRCRASRQCATSSIVARGHRSRAGLRASRRHGPADAKLHQSPSGRQRIRSRAGARASSSPFRRSSIPPAPSRPRSSARRSRAWPAFAESRPWV